MIIKLCVGPLQYMAFALELASWARI